ncbi:MAG: aldehyde dehydrogenase family protein [Pseudomonadota bacterium]
MAKTTDTRLTVAKTYKLFINGKFPRTESGRYYKVADRKGGVLANACLASRKDLREAVVAARACAKAWQSTNAYLRSQILYRMAEMLEARRASFVDVRRALGDTPQRAERAVDGAVDDIVYYAGWCDKLTQVFGAINPVATSHYNFSSLEPVGVVGALAARGGGLTGLIDALLPALAGGNTVVALADTDDPLTAILLAEVIHASDVPAGVVNILTGEYADVGPHMARHKDVNAVVHALAAGEVRTQFEREAAINIKRVVGPGDQRSNAAASPYRILATTETKTTWHPVGT